MNFKIEPFIECAEILVSQDETLLALKVLESIPAYYRDNVPVEIAALKKEIMSKITLPYDLLSDLRELPKDNTWSIQYMNNTARGLALKNLVRDLNSKSIEPHIVEMGPGDFTFAIGLNEEGYKFSYDCFTLNERAKDLIAVKLVDKWNPKVKRNDIFVAYELIEHLHEIKEIRECFDRLTPVAKYVLLSTPRYTYANGTPNWRLEGIHHLRAYSPREFQIEAIRMFPEYDFGFIDNEVMVLHGERRGHFRAP